MIPVEAPARNIVFSFTFYGYLYIRENTGYSKTGKDFKNHEFGARPTEQMGLFFKLSIKKNNCKMYEYKRSWF